MKLFARWSDTVLDVYVRSPYSYYFVMGFFNSYYFISKVVIASIVEGKIMDYTLTFIIFTLLRSYLGILSEDPRKLRTAQRN